MLLCKRMSSYLLFLWMTPSTNAYSERCPIHRVQFLIAKYLGSKLSQQGRLGDRFWDEPAEFELPHTLNLHLQPNTLHHHDHDRGYKALRYQAPCASSGYERSRCKCPLPRGTIVLVFEVRDSLCEAFCFLIGSRAGCCRHQVSCDSPHPGFSPV